VSIAPIDNPADIPLDQRCFYRAHECEKCDGFGYLHIKKPCSEWDEWGNCTSDCYEHNCEGSPFAGVQREICRTCWGHGKLYEYVTALQQLAECSE